MTAPSAHPVLILVAIAIVILLLRQLAWLLVRLGVRTARHLPATVAGSRAWARLHPWRAILAERFPRAYRLAARRLDPHRFAGLPLTLMVMAALYFALLFGGLVEELEETAGLIAFDDQASALVGPWRTAGLVELFAAITNLGGMAALTAAAVVATAFLWADHRPAFILPLWVTIVGSQATTYLGKIALDRARPEFVTEVTAASPSFPSGHTTGAMAVYGFIAYAGARDLIDPRQRFEVTFWAGILILLIAFSRVFLSVHYASDVLAGFLVGGFWLLVGFAIAEHRRQGAPNAGG